MRILNSALKVKSIRCGLITSSLAAILPASALSNGDTGDVYPANSRLLPLPSAPWGDYNVEYRAAKALALDATDRFRQETSPFFTIV